ncbi:hypothetical protein [Aquimarina sp. 2201CG14-23]|uniref:hypothetical protein n=1 Tax=Aquimarina mycalae TaxID=3040073 RepID=UPI002477E70F|nr:hypothetical protein [Aquimarina sp. 2201CG14-23]MDH7447646.1 hypothetical protein [Aquimarina sp. 2201CG14-23]
MEEKEKVMHSLFYKEVNALLRDQFSAIKQNITPQYEQLLKEREFPYPLPIICQFEYASWGRNKQWRLELDFDEYQWSNKTVKPHFLNALVSIEMGTEFLHFKYHLCSSFNDSLEPKETEKIPIKKLDDSRFVSEKIDALKQFLEDLPQGFIQEIKTIDFNELEFIEDIEEVYQIINLHKVNDTKKFYARTQLFLLEVIQLMNEYINDYEKIILKYTRKMYSEEIQYCNNTLKSFRIIVAEKKYDEVNCIDERVHILHAINGYLTPFEEYSGNDEDKRPYELDYKIDDLIQAGLKREQLLPLIKKHFAEIFTDDE